MNVQQLRESLEGIPGYWPVHVAVRADREDDSMGTDFLFTLDCTTASFKTQGNMAVIRVNYYPD